MNKNSYRIHNDQGAYLMTVRSTNERSALRQARNLYFVPFSTKLTATLIN